MFSVEIVLTFGDEEKDSFNTQGYFGLKSSGLTLMARDYQRVLLQINPSKLC